MDIRLESISKSYNKVDGPVINNVSHTFSSGSFTALMGRSGSGKSTLLNIISGLLTPTSGDVLYGDRSLYRLNDMQRSSLRARSTATIFQDYNLLDFLSVEENILLAQRINGKAKNSMSPHEALGMVGLEGYEKKMPNEISGGQKQRVAIARALSVRPSVIFADEPTGALDERNSKIVVDLLRSVAQNNVTVVMVTHDPYIAAEAHCVLQLRDGSITNILNSPTPKSILEAMRSTSNNVKEM